MGWFLPQRDHVSARDPRLDDSNVVKLNRDYNDFRPLWRRAIENVNGWFVSLSHGENQGGRQLEIIDLCGKCVYVSVSAE